MPGSTIRVGASLVLIPARVETPNGASVTDLPKESFHLFDDNSEQNITYFAKEDAPVSIGVLLDTSASMEHKMRMSSQAAASVLQSANPGDEFFLIEFANRARLTVPFTTNADRLYHRLTRADPFGRTSLLDAVHVASVQMKKASNARKALLIVSDGGDNHSRVTRSQVRSEVLESDLQLYAIGIFDDEASMRSEAEANGPGLLEELAGETGGKHYRVNNLDDLGAAARRISIDMRNQYLLGFSPDSVQSDGKYHRIKVTADPSNGTKLNVFYRRGYYAPAQ